MEEWRGQGGLSDEGHGENALAMQVGGREDESCRPC